MADSNRSKLAAAKNIRMKVLERFRRKKSTKLNPIDSILFKQMCHNLRNGVPFSFVRYGDGEWNAILNEAGSNCDGHRYFPDMNSHLKAIVLRRPQYIMGIQNHAIRTLGDKIEPIIKESNNVWVNADVLHYASVDNALNFFFEALAQTNNVLIGPSYLSNITVFKYAKHIIVPQVNCWSEKDRIHAELSDYLRNANPKSVFLFCASMMSNVLIDILYQEYGSKHFFLDIGSLFDPYAGKATRGYHKKIMKRTSPWS